MGNDFYDFYDTLIFALLRKKILTKAEKSSNMLKKSSKTLGGSRAYLCIRIQKGIEPASKARAKVQHSKGVKPACRQGVIKREFLDKPSVSPNGHAERNNKQ